MSASNGKRARLDSDNSSWPQPAAASASTPLRGMARLPSDCRVYMTQFLLLREIARLASSCKSFNALCSLKLEGGTQPSLALARRQLLTEEKSLSALGEQEMQRLLRSMPMLKEAFLAGVLRADADLRVLIETSGASLQLLDARDVRASAQTWRLAFSCCVNLHALAIGLAANTSSSTSSSFAAGLGELPGLNSLRKLTVCTLMDGETGCKLLRACPRIETYFGMFPANDAEAQLMASKLPRSVRTLMIVSSCTFHLASIEHLQSSLARLFVTSRCQAPPPSAVFRALKTIWLNAQVVGEWRPSQFPALKRVILEVTTSMPDTVERVTALLRGLASARELVVRLVNPWLSLTSEQQAELLAHGVAENDVVAMITNAAQAIGTLLLLNSSPASAQTPPAAATSAPLLPALQRLFVVHNSGLETGKIEAAFATFRAERPSVQTHLANEDHATFLDELRSDLGE